MSCLQGGGLVFLRSGVGKSSVCGTSIFGFVRFLVSSALFSSVVTSVLRSFVIGAVLLRL